LKSGVREIAIWVILEGIDCRSILIPLLAVDWIAAMLGLAGGVNGEEDVSIVIVALSEISDRGTKLVRRLPNWSEIVPERVALRLVA